MPLTSSPDGVVILGMHRSGTSAVTRVINLLGLEISRADDLYTAHDNPAHWESASLIACNDQILERFGGTWWRPPRLRAGWERSPDAEALLPMMRTTFDDVYRDIAGSWLWKDPRTCLTFPLWRRLFGGVVVVFAWRDPAAVVNSLSRRDGLRPAYAHALNTHYVGSALRAAAGLPTATVEYDALVADPMSATERLRSALSQLGLDLRGSTEEAARAVGSGRPPSRGGRQPTPSVQQLRALPDTTPALELPGSLLAALGTDSKLHRMPFPFGLRKPLTERFTTS